MTDSRNANEARATEPTIIHLDPELCLSEAQLMVSADGVRTPLTRHTEESRAQAREEAKQLRDLPDSALAFYTEEPVHLPVRGVYRIHIVSQREGEPAHANGLCAMHVAGEGKKTPHLHINAVSTVQTMLFHHSDLMSTDPEVASVVMEHMQAPTAQDTYYHIEAVAQLMRAMGPVILGKPGWAGLESMQAPDVTADGGFDYDNTHTTFMVQPSDAVMEAAGQAMSMTLNSTKNDLRLQGTKWFIQEGEAVIREPTSSQAEEAKAMAGVEPIQVSLATEGSQAASDWHVTVTNTKKTDGLTVSATTVDSESQKVSVTFTNSYIRYLCGYVEFLDADGNVMSGPWAADATQLEILEGLGEIFEKELGFRLVQSDSLHLLGILACRNTLFGIPGTGPEGELEIEFTFPEGAVSANLYGSGLGIGEFNNPEAYLIGTILTLIANLAIPAVFLITLSKATSYAGLIEVLADLEEVSKITKVFLAFFGGTLLWDAAVDHTFNWSALLSIAKLLMDPALVRVLDWVILNVTAAKVEEAIPFIGWGIVAMNVASNLSLLGQTIGETFSSPWEIKNSLSSTQTTTVTIYPDPRHQAWPAAPADSEVSCDLKVIFQDGRPTLELNQALSPEFSDPTLVFSYQNTLGGEVKFEANYWIDDWQAAKATTGWMKNDASHTEAITLYLVENPVPLTRNSVYAHASLLTYQDEQYKWQSTTEAPQATRQVASPDQTGNNISTWNGLTLSQRHALLGMAWKASGTGLDSVTSGVGGQQLNAFMNVDIPGAPMDGVKFPDAGFDGYTRLVFDPYPPKFLMWDGNWVVPESTGRPVPDPRDQDLGAYYVDPRKGESTDPGGGYHLRAASLTPGEPFDLAADLPSYGRFPYEPNSIVLHPSGFSVAVNQRYAKIMVTPLPETARADDKTPLARIYAGQGQNYQGSDGRAGLLVDPVAVTCNYDGRLLILESSHSEELNLSRLQAFDVDGNPDYCFTDGEGNRSPFLPLRNDVTYLDLTCSGDRKMTYVWLLYYTGGGSEAGDYEVAILRFGNRIPTQNPLVVTEGVSAAAVAADMWHSLYTLNYAMTTDGEGNDAGPGGSGTGPAGRTAPSMSMWLPPIPSPPTSGQS